MTARYMFLFASASLHCIVVRPKKAQVETTWSCSEGKGIDSTSWYNRLATKCIKNHQRASKWIKKHQNSMKIYQKSSKSIKMHQKSSNSIKMHRKLSASIKMHQKLSASIKMHLSFQRWVRRRLLTSCATSCPQAWDPALASTGKVPPNSLRVHPWFLSSTKPREVCQHYLSISIYVSMSEFKYLI